MLPEQETELKLRLLDPSQYDRMAADASPGGAVPENRTDSGSDNIYYDTADRRLLSNCFALRVRTVGTHAVATVKDMGTMSGGLYVRGEWNTPLGADESPENAFARLPIGEKLTEIIAESPLVPLMKTTYKRVSAELRSGGSIIEFSADSGRISAGRKSVPLCEAELELKSGSVADLLKLGARLAECYPLLIEKQSKFERGLILSGLPQAPETPPQDAPGKTVRDVISAHLIREIAAVFDLQAQFLDKPGRAESAHQFRVGLRRLRALLSFARPALNAAEYTRFSGKLRTLAAEFSAIRELDVLWETWRIIQRERPEIAGQIGGLEKVLHSERRKERTRLGGVMKSAPATAVLLELWAAVTGDIWTAQADADFGKLGGKRLKKWTSRFRSGLNSADLTGLSEAHSLRILGKKLRYVQDTLFTEDTKGVPVKDLKRYQNLLGRLCDAKRNIQLLKTLRKLHDNPPVCHDVALLTSSEKLRVKDSVARIKKEVSKK